MICNENIGQFICIRVHVAQMVLSSETFHLRIGNSILNMILYKTSMSLKLDHMTQQQTQ